MIISGKQVHTLTKWLDMYADGDLVIDEFGTLAASFGGETIRRELEKTKPNRAAKPQIDRYL